MGPDALPRYAKGEPLPAGQMRTPLVELPLGATGAQGGSLQPGLLQHAVWCAAAQLYSGSKPSQQVAYAQLLVQTGADPPANCSVPAQPALACTTTTTTDALPPSLLACHPRRGPHLRHH